ncbi:hypothetical protein PVAP13_5KG129487 [Panicum virgatum]|uniref:Uncharacterized protein n=1 Tax=Panicum virgatum TaxID=38727 RepID=A0A8T0SF96_PANVG|nr:hypothetical protein PVAP13_5KG129487 [Panicum virgatum]
MAYGSLTGHSSPAAHRPATGTSQVAPAGPSAPVAHHGATQGHAGAVRGDSTVRGGATVHGGPELRFPSIGLRRTLARGWGSWRGSRVTSWCLDWGSEVVGGGSSPWRGGRPWQRSARFEQRKKKKNEGRRKEKEEEDAGERGAGSSDEDGEGGSAAWAGTRVAHGVSRRRSWPTWARLGLCVCGCFHN